MHRGLFSMQLHWTAAAFQLHASSPSWPFEPELRTLWNVMTDLKWKKCIEQHTELRIESSQLWREGKFFALVAENLRVINNIVKSCKHVRRLSIWRIELKNSVILFESKIYTKLVAFATIINFTKIWFHNIIHVTIKSN